METEELKVYWQPGCSSCVRVKELLSALDIPYRSINILAEPEELADLMRLGPRSVPVVRRGNDYIFAQSMEDVAEFVGKPMAANRLPAGELTGRMVHLLDTTRELIGMIPDDRLTERAYEKRPRTVGDLAVHIFQPPHAFLEAMENGLEDIRVIVSAKRDELSSSKGAILGYADMVTARLKNWSATAKVDPESRIVTYYGLQPVHQLLERTTWHAAQHVRQLGLVLDGFGQAGSAKIDSAVYEGLPMPQGIWE